MANDFTDQLICIKQVDFKDKEIYANWQNAHFMKLSQNSEYFITNLYLLDIQTNSFIRKFDDQNSDVYFTLDSQFLAYIKKITNIFYLHVYCISKNLETVMELQFSPDSITMIDQIEFMINYKEGFDIFRLNNNNQFQLHKQVRRKKTVDYMKQYVWGSQYLVSKGNKLLIQYLCNLILFQDFQTLKIIKKLQFKGYIFNITECVVVNNLLLITLENWIQIIDSCTLRLIKKIRLRKSFSYTTPIQRDNVVYLLSIRSTLQGQGNYLVIHKILPTNEIYPERLIQSSEDAYCFRISSSAQILCCKDKEEIRIYKW